MFPVYLISFIYLFFISLLLLLRGFSLASPSSFSVILQSVPIFLFPSPPFLLFSLPFLTNIFSSLSSLNFPFMLYFVLSIPILLLSSYSSITFLSSTLSLTRAFPLLLLLQIYFLFLFFFLLLNFIFVLFIPLILHSPPLFLLFFFSFSFYSRSSFLLLINFSLLSSTIRHHVSLCGQRVLMALCESGMERESHFGT